MTQKIKSLFGKSVTAFIFCLLFSGCVFYPEDDRFGGFPQNVREALLSNGVPFFEGPPEIVGLNFSPNYSDYTGSDEMLLSYIDASQEHFDDYAGYLIAEFGSFFDASEDGYICYGWDISNSNATIGVGFTNQSVSAPVGNVPPIPPDTLFFFIITY
jgi:hypothetical protein